MEAPMGISVRRIALVAACIGSLPGVASAHLERPSQFPSGNGSVPSYRTAGPRLVVCKTDSLDRAVTYPKAQRIEIELLYGECMAQGFRDLQAAVDAVNEPGTRILVLPGRYYEKPSLRAPRGHCAAIADKFPLSYEEQLACPHLHNLVAILGDGPDADIACDGRLCGLQIEGVGQRPEDVIIDGRFRKLNVLRADRADGVYFRNFTVQNSSFNALYIIETDGFVIDHMLGRWNDEYAYLTFSSDHGLYTDSESYGNGDSGIYPGSAADLHGERTAIEIRRCKSHHNMAGLSGTAGNSLYVHDNDFFANTVGISLDSLFPGHPGLPQDSSVFVHNRIWRNNRDYNVFWRNGTCFKPSAERGYPKGTVCPQLGAPVGTGVSVIGGNLNLFQDNWVWDNWRAGFLLLWAPAVIRGEEDPDLLFDTSHFNRYLGNHMGSSPAGTRAPNGVDFFWDEEGEGNCWEGNTSAQGVIRSDPPVLPTCEPPAAFSPGNQEKAQLLLACLAWTPLNPDPPGCEFTRQPPRPQ
jgi:hypothetical protein